MASNTPSVFLADPDVTLYHGDVLATLRELPAESVDCVVTSPPYWGLRDYGQEGQLGLEPTPEQYVERMVEVFREVRRVLAAHGTCWLNLGDSYAHSLRQSGKAHAGEKQNTNEGSMRQGFKPLPGGMKEKDLVGVPWRVAFALQADGWYLRSDIIWSKPNPMPESVTDRPTKAHEYVFLLSKEPRYFFDQEAVREKAEWNRWGDQTVKKPQPGTASWIKPKGKNELPRSEPQRDRRVAGFNERWDESEANGTAPLGRNIRSVWEIATQPYPEAHFATFPEELARRAIAAGCPEQVCRVCGKARERIVGRTPGTLGWTTCICPALEVGGAVVTKWRPGVVLDPFVGSGTVAHVARKFDRRSIGIDLSTDYLALAARRLQQQSLFATESI